MVSSTTKITHFPISFDFNVPDISPKFLKKILELALPEDSIYRKLLACIPIIGIIPTIINERSLRTSITQANEPDRLIKFITIKNHYKAASIVREFTSVALIITAIALDILGSPVALLGITAGALPSFYAYNIHKNRQLIGELQTNGFPPLGITIR